jgi:hypothetical protein
VRAHNQEHKRTTRAAHRQDQVQNNRFPSALRQGSNGGTRVATKQEFN